MSKHPLSIAIFSALLAYAGAASAQSTADTETDNDHDHQHEQIKLEDIEISALPFRRSKLEAKQPVNVLAGDYLNDRRGLTLGETLQNEPGVHATQYGAGSSRPIIRGLSGSRVSTLEDGLDSADVGGLSVDHATTIDPMLVERIEVLRGPSTLLYGSGAIGGVVNVVDNRIPEQVPAETTGAFEVRGGTAADEKSGVLRLDGGGGNFAWHLDGTWRDAGDYEIPGFARVEHDHEDEGHDHEGEEHEHEEENPFGIVPNSFVETQSATVGASYVADRGFIGASVRTFDTEYGISAPHSHGEEDHDHEGEHALRSMAALMRPFDEGDEHEHDHEEESVYIDMRQRRYDISGGLQDPLPGFTDLRLRMSYTDYFHAEVESEEGEHEHDEHTLLALKDGEEHEEGEHMHGTTFDRETFQTRLELEHAPLAGWRGVLGLQFNQTDFIADGEEAFVPPNETRSIGLFVLEERDFDALTLSGGVRVEHTEVERKLGGEDHDHEHSAAILASLPMDEEDHEHDHEGELEGPDRRSKTSWSASVGALYSFSEQWQASLSANRAQRAASATELYANGPHLATFTFDVGNPFLDKETSNGVDLVLHHHSDLLDFEASIFYTDVDDYIYLAPTGQERDGFDVRTAEQADAKLYGAELSALYHVGDFSFGEIDLRGSWDTVTAELDSGANLPRISPSRLKAGVEWRMGDWRGAVEATRVSDQNDVAENEDATPGYTMTNLRLAYNLPVSVVSSELYLKVNNVFDQEARVHTSFLRDFAPLPGRNVIVGLRGTF
jgi:iron complex outermembrane receptor protein